MTDPFDAYKRDIEERDRVKMLADDARGILGRLEDADERPREELIRLLMGEHNYSWNEATDALNSIEWDDNRHDLSEPR